MQEKISHSLVQTLRGIPDFSTLDEKTLLEVVGESMNLFWRAGSSIFEPGAPGDALYVMLAGEVAIYDGPGDQEVAHPRPGDFFGEMSLLMNTTHSRTAMAVTDCEILVLPKGAFEGLLHRNPPLAKHFEGVLGARRPRELSDRGVAS
jgi:cAMP-dependent protein kinase regulator